MIPFPPTPKSRVEPSGNETPSATTGGSPNECRTDASGGAVDKRSPSRLRERLVGLALRFRAALTGYWLLLRRRLTG